MTRPATHKIGMALAATALVAMSTGCATKGFVRQEMSSLENRVTPASQQAQADARSAQTLAQGADARARQVEIEAQMARDLALGNIKREEVRRVTVNFEFDSAEIPDESQSALDAVASDLMQNLNYMALVTGYTDDTGDELYNIGLAQRRAAAVQLHLARQLGNEELNEFQLAASDVITFHNYLTADRLECQISELELYKRPIICTEWMARTCGSLVSTNLPVFATKKLAASIGGWSPGRPTQSSPGRICKTP